MKEILRKLRTADLLVLQPSNFLATSHHRGITNEHISGQVTEVVLFLGGGKMRVTFELLLNYFTRCCFGTKLDQHGLIKYEQKLARKIQSK